MMTLEEGGDLLGDGAPHEGAIDRCVDNPRPGADWDVALCLAMGNAADAVEIMCVGFILSEMSDDISSTQKELLSAAVFMGMLAGGLLGGFFSDVIGRRRSLIISLFINTVAGLLSALSINVAMLISMRVVAGIGIGASVPIVFSLGAEVFPSPRRGFFLSIIASFWMVGAIYTAFTAWVILGKDINGQRILPGGTWRYFAAISALPAIAALLLAVFKVPESPRFLVSQARYDEAAALLSSMSTVRVEAADLRAAETLSTKLAHSQHGRGVTLSETLHVLWSNRMRATTLVLCGIWFTLSFGSYGISTWISVLFDDVGIGNAYAASFIFALANLPGNLVSLLLIDRCGRRALLGWGMGLAGLSALGFALDTRDAAVVVLFASLFNAFSTQGWNSLDCLSAEMFPTEARSTAMGVLAACGRLGAIAGQFVNGSLESNIPLLLFVTTSCSLVGGLISFALPYDSAGPLHHINVAHVDDPPSRAEVAHVLSGDAKYTGSAEYSPVHLLSGLSDVDSAQQRQHLVV